MGTFGPLAGATFASDATVGVVGITSPANAGLSDNVYATSVLALTQLSNYLKATNFGFNIPLDAIITGVTVNVERSGSLLNAITDNSIKLVKGGTISGNEKASANLWPTTDAIATYGSSTDLWGLTLTPVDINNPNFGVAISASATLAGTASIDFISISVDYLGSNRAHNILRYAKVGGGMSRGEVMN